MKNNPFLKRVTILGRLPLLLLVLATAAIAQETPEPVTPALAESPAPSSEPAPQTAAKAVKSAEATLKKASPVKVPVPQTPEAGESQAVACKIIVVDPVAQTITVETGGQLHLLKINPQAKIMRKGKLVTLDHVAPGQEVVVLVRPLNDGSIEVVSLAIGPSRAQIQAAGSNNKGTASAPGINTAAANFPFTVPGNPANNVGDNNPIVVVSPNN
jgi:hypothetical protein